MKFYLEKLVRQQTSVVYAYRVSFGAFHYHCVSMHVLCVAVGCGHPGRPPYSVLFGSTFTFPHTVQYQCPLGFTLSGSRQRECMSTGSWSGVVPSCFPISCSMPVVPRYSRLVQLNKTFSGFARFACLPGYIHTIGLASVKCGADGQWIAAEAMRCTRE